MKKTIALSLLTLGLAFGQDAAKPVATPPPTIEQLQELNTRLIKEVRLLKQKLALLNALNNIDQQITGNEAAPAKSEPVKKDK